MLTSTIHVAGHDLAVVRGNEMSDGIPVVYVHGVLVSARFWPAVLDPLVAAGHPWFSVSLPAHYPSRAPREFRARGPEILLDLFADIYSEAVRQLVGGRSVVFICHSTGGFAAIAMALRHPELLAASVSVAGFSVGRWGSVEGLLVELGRRQDRLGLALFKASLALTNATSLGYRLASLFLVRRKWAYWRNPLTRNALAAAHEDFRRSDTNDLYALFAKIADVDVRSEQPPRGAPLHLVYANRDPVVRLSYSLELARQFPDARVHALSGLGHMMFLEGGTEYADVMSSIFDGLRQST